MSERYAAVTTAYTRISDGSRRLMATPTGDVRISDDATGTKYAKRKANTDFFCPLGRETYVRAETGTVDIEIIG